MSIFVAPVSNSSTFGGWLQQTNRVIDIISTNTVTTDNTANGSLTTGNARIDGNVTVTSLFVANTIYGGLSTNIANLRLAANVIIANNTANVAVFETSGVATFSGSVGIARAPSFTLDVNGSFRTTNLTTTANSATFGSAAWIAANGFVGIGTSSPTTRLDVTGGIQGANLVLTTNVATFGSAVWAVSNGFVGIGTSSPTVRLDVTGGIQGANLVLTTNVATFGSAVWAVSNGFVGIGTSSPTVRLDVTGGIRGANLVLTTNVLTVGNVFWIAANGNVGIRTSTPSFELEVIGFTHTIGLIVPGGYDRFVRFGNNVVWVDLRDIGTKFVGINTGSPEAQLDVAGNVRAQELRLTTNTFVVGNALSIVSNGFVGIGTASPTTRLDVNGSIRGANLTLTTNSVVVGNVFWIAANGNVGIRTSVPSFDLEVAATTHTLGLIVPGGSDRFVRFGNNIVWVDLRDIGTKFVGINTGSPEAQLDVAGNVRAQELRLTTNTFVVGNALSIEANGFININRTTAPQFRVDLQGAARANSFFATANIGIGTTTPATELHVVGGTRTNTAQVLDTLQVNTQFYVYANGFVGVRTASPTVTVTINATDAIRIPVGNSSTRPAGAAGLIRFNNELNQYEGHDGVNWTPLGAANAAAGAGIFYVSSRVLTANYSLPSDTRSIVAGDIEIANGAVLTILENARLVIV